jgi:hypothetical protein
VPGPFALADQNGLHALFDDAGFTELTVGTVAVSAHAPSFDAWWARTQRMAGPAVAVLAALDSSARDRIRDSLRASTSQYAGRDGDLRLPGLALVVGGKRP